ncbi:N-acetylglutamate kinase [Pontibacter ummariensis]|uniref:Acetylglutamate kinase n=1 Tax=Pontibacter ummariensis TaxID=1610492 RepID=A0A239BUM3_9BACT|nr:acetylglutamate kinase [Pontibacter ummariensis]PRY15609.1 N-acetylglutamate kinase [Pontibacter ummariensis]SNS11626.1 N-acetylglutamate kinase [Pontibacter ummariensis]
MQELNIVKIGGNILDNPLRLKSFLLDFAALPGLKLLVHGGGKIASAIGQKLGITPVMVEGRRVTDAETLELVTMVYGGLVNKQVVAQLQAQGCNAIGLTGADANSIPATKRPVRAVDYGFAGDVAGPESINVNVLEALLQQGLTPVFAPLTHDQQGTMLNTNADTIASVLATALATKYQVKLVYSFEKRGVLQDANDNNSVIPAIDKEKYRQLKEEKVVSAGMIPKLDNAFAALEQGVSAVVIGDAAEISAILSEGKAGTLITL